MAKECKICGASYVRSRREAYGLCPTCVFWSLVDKTSSPYGCWLWNGALSNGGGKAGGYGQFCLTVPNGDYEHAAHRISWVLANGDIPDELCVLHNCDEFYPARDITNRRCVNPAHLRLGTKADNTRDCVVRGRQYHNSGPEHWAVIDSSRMSRGDSHYSRLHPEKLARGPSNGTNTHPEKLARGIMNHNARLNDDIVRQIRSSKEYGSALAKRFGVSGTTISHVRRNLIWKHIV